MLLSTGFPPQFLSSFSSKIQRCKYINIKPCLSSDCSWIQFFSNYWVVKSLLKLKKKQLSRKSHLLHRLCSACRKWLMLSESYIWKLEQRWETDPVKFQVWLRQTAAAGFSFARGNESTKSIFCHWLVLLLLLFCFPFPSWLQDNPPAFFSRPQRLCQLMKQKCSFQILLAMSKCIP